MANGDGGWIIFGVKDRAAGGTVDERFVGIPTLNDYGREFGSKAKRIQPDLFFEPSNAIRIPDRPDRIVFVVRIPQGQRRPYMIEPQGVFYRRSEGGAAEPMRWHEVRDLMVITEERLRRVTLFRIQMRLFVRLASDLQRYNAGMVNAMRRFDVTAFSALLPDVCAVLPPDLHLMERLLDIPMAANRVNLYFDRFNTDFTNAGYVAQHVSGDLDEIVRRGQECEERLTSLLGPIEAG